MSSILSDSALLRFAESAMPTCENSLSTAADDAGQPRYCRAIIKSGVKPSISGDLWSDSGMGLFGIFAHGITETWVMEKALIGLVACEKELHTAVNTSPEVDG